MPLLTFLVRNPLVPAVLLALLWANSFPDQYQTFINYPLWQHAPIGHLHDGHHTLTVHFLVNDVLMALFFAVAGKEVWEAIALKNGAFRGSRALTPLAATLGGMAGPIIVYLGIASMLGGDTLAAVKDGWAIPTATDIAFSYMVGCLIFGARHPAVGFLLLLAIADDAGGLLILAVAYPTGDIAPQWLLLSFGAAALVYTTCAWWPRQSPESRAWVRQRLGYWPYITAGLVSWYGFQMAGLHPALGLLPVIPAIPHAENDLGIFAEEEDRRRDLLNQLEHLMKWPMPAVLFVFGLANAGVILSAIGTTTWLVLCGLMVGKPLGIFICGAAAALVWGLPDGMKRSDILVLGCVAGIGFTVALFVAGVAFPSGTIQDGAKMGALLSLLSFFPALVFSRILHTRRMT